MKGLALAQWCARSIMASYPQGERMPIARAADAYMRWLDSLPVRANG